MVSFSVDNRLFMYLRRIGFFITLIVLLNCGCGKSGSLEAAPATASNVPPAETIGSLHWLGKDQLAKATNASGFMRFWNQPQSARLESQTLDKLSIAPWRMFPQVATTNTAAARLLRPLLDDCVRQECYVEARGSGLQGEFAFAIRLDGRRSGVWETNLAEVLGTLTGIKPAANAARRGWSLQKHHHPNLIELARVGDWTIVAAAQDRNGLLDDMSARIQRDRTPVVAPASNHWLAAEFDLARVRGMWSSNFNSAGNSPRITLHVGGDGEKVNSRLQLDFPKPLEIGLNPWVVPTNLVQEPLASFVAIRGIAPWLRSIRQLAGVDPKLLPDQIFLWDKANSPPFNTYFALLVNNATRTLGTLALPLGIWVDSHVSKKYGSIVVHTNGNGLSWKGLPYASPFVQSATNSGREFLFGGFAPYPQRARSMPDELARHVLEGTNLVYFEWEITGQKVVHCRYLEDVCRLLFDERGPLLREEMASLQWLSCNLTNLSHCVSELRLENPGRLVFMRKSTVGLNALEIGALANLLEAPEFPYNFRSLLITNQLPVETPKVRRPNRPAGSTNAGSARTSPGSAPPR
jgi:hypothetical protein